MLLKVGQLAKSTGISVRTLHHYDEIDLLSPSARTDSGHRLYNRADVIRLHRIQSLKQLGISLQQIAVVIADNGHSLTDIMDLQLKQLEEDAQRINFLQLQLRKLHQHLKAGAELESADLLNNLMLMTLYQKYFTPQEFSAYHAYVRLNADELENEWPPLVSAIKLLIESGVGPEHLQAQALVLHWVELLERLTGNNPDILIKLDQMTRYEPEMQIYNGITPEVIRYVEAAMAVLHTGIFKKYLTDKELESIVSSRKKAHADWPSLIAAIRQQMQAGATPESDAIQPLAKQWRNIFDSAGNDAIQSKLRIAYQQEPLLTRGTGLDQSLLVFISRAIKSIPGT